MTTPEAVPPAVETALVQLETSLAELRTTAARLAEPPTPSEDVDPDVLAEAAARPDAPPEAVALARAVERGETTWAAVAAGRADVPEVLALREAAFARELREEDETRGRRAR